MTANRLARTIGVCTILLAATSAGPWTLNAGAQTTFFKFQSTPGSWVGHGYLNYSITPADGWTFEAATSADHSYVSLKANDPRPGAPTSNYYWTLDLEAPNGAPLAPGTYTGAFRFPFNAFDEPGLTLSGNHRGNNQNTGYFSVLEAVYGSGAVLTRFAVAFRQYDEGNPNNFVDGDFRYNSLIPEPCTVALVAAAAPFLLARHRRG